MEGTILNQLDHGQCWRTGELRGNWTGKGMFSFSAWRAADCPETLRRCRNSALAVLARLDRQSAAPPGVTFAHQTS